MSGSIDTGDPTQIDRLFRSGFPQTCPASTTCATFGDGTAAPLRSVPFTNTTGATQCVTVDTNTACTGTNFIFTAAYLGSFDPANICTNWIGDSGCSPDPVSRSQFNLDDGQTVVMVVSEVTPDAGCSSYTVTWTRYAVAREARRLRRGFVYLHRRNGAAGPGRRLTRIRQRSCAMASPRPPLTSMSLVVWTTAPPRTPSTVWTSPLERGTSRAPMPFSGEAPTCALDGIDGHRLLRGRIRHATASHPTTSPPTPGRHWLPIRLLRITTALHRVPSMARCLSRVAPPPSVTPLDVYDVATNTWSPGTAAPKALPLAGYQQVGQFLYVVGGFDPSSLTMQPPCVWT